ncbi:unnamed protein product [Gordionus sp. m RMFG-2023]
MKILFIILGIFAIFSSIAAQKKLRCCNQSDCKNKCTTDGACATVYINYKGETKYKCIPKNLIKAVCSGKNHGDGDVYVKCCNKTDYCNKKL